MWRKDILQFKVSSKKATDFFFWSNIFKSSQLKKFMNDDRWQIWKNVPDYNSAAPDSKGLKSLSHPKTSRWGKVSPAL